MKSVEPDVRHLGKSMSGVMWVALKVRSKIYLEAFTCHYRMKKELAGNIDLYPNYLKRIFIKK